MLRVRNYDIKEINIRNYSSNNNTALELVCEDGVPLAIITKNLEDLLENNMAYIDTNNCPWAEDFLIDNDFGLPTGEYKASGFCNYPLYKLDLEEISKYNLTNQ